MMLLRTELGSFRGEYAGTLFLIPYYVGTHIILGEPISDELRDGFQRYLWSQQHEDGGWGLDIESQSYVVSSVTNYVALRLLGVPADDPRLQRARAWFLPRGGALKASSWGKFLLTILGLYDYEGLNPLTPEMWLLSPKLPIHPSRYWVHCRMVYLPMSYLYAHRFSTPQTPTLKALRDEIYDEPYATIDWPKARRLVADSDAYTPYSKAMHVAYDVLAAYEKRHSKRLRKRALEVVIDHIRVEDESTGYVCVGPLNKLLDAIVWHVHAPGCDAVRRHIERMPDYLWKGDDGIKVKSYNSSESWDTAFAVQAMAAADALTTRRDELAGAQRFLEAEQVIDDVPNGSAYFRDRRRGGWGFGTRRQGWPVTDCTAEAVKALDILQPLELDAPTVSRARIDDAIDLMLEMQNAEGGWPTYERTRGPRWLELFNPSDFFAEIMIEYSYIECSSSVMQALARYRDRQEVDATRLAKITRALARGAEWLLRVQREDGSWEGFWGVCFTYGTWFGIEGLRAAGLATDHPAIRRAVRFLLERQRADGGWSETIESSRQRRYVEAEASQTVQTSWAMLALIAAGEGASTAVERGVRYLVGKQRPDGSWAKEHVAGVTNRNCAIDYVAYWSIFPVWALGAARHA